MERRLKKFSFLVIIALFVQMLLPYNALGEQQEGQSSVLEQSEEYRVDFKNGNNGRFAAAYGQVNLEVRDEQLHASGSGDIVIIDELSPSMTNGIYKMKMQINTAPVQFGLIFRYVDEHNFAGLIQDGMNHWLYFKKEQGQTSYGNINTKPYTIPSGQIVTYELQYEDQHISLLVNDQEVFEGDIPQLPIQAGQVGMRSWYQHKQWIIDEISLASIQHEHVPPPISELAAITSATGNVTAWVDQHFPRVEQYDLLLDGKEVTVHGQAAERISHEVMLNGRKYRPNVQLLHLAANHAQYELVVPNLLTFQVDIQVQDYELDFSVSQIQEQGDFRLRKLEFPQHELVTIHSTEPAAHQTAAWITNQWNVIHEEYNDLRSDIANQQAGRTYAFLNTDQVAASLLTNVVEGTNKVTVAIERLSDGSKQAALWSGAWTYRESDVVEPDGEPFWAKVVFAGDANGDGKLDWQDAAIAYRQVSDTKLGASEYLLSPYGHELIRDHISYISMNIGSTTSSPFLRAFDNAKKIHHLTDGFGQMILFKGYQAEGHDDSHPDYGGHIGIRQGGQQDFSYVLREGKKYNILGGVHINATEYMLDAFEVDLDTLHQPLQPGWGWLDQAYNVNKRKDIESGELKRRLDMLKDDTGDDLSFVYVDVYAGSGWDAKQLATILNDHGWMIGTEYAGAIHEQVAWIHWGTDPGYPVQGKTNQITRFLRNHVADAFNVHPLLKGHQQVGVGYWQKILENYSYHRTAQAFFEHNLPTKYMQYFPIIRWEENAIHFEHNVKVQREADGKVHLYKDNRRLAIMTDTSNLSTSTVFIPWNPLTEEKIYHWNPAGGTTTWEVPLSWADTQSAWLYELCGVTSNVMTPSSISGDF